MKANINTKGNKFCHLKVYVANSIAGVQQASHKVWSAQIGGTGQDPKKLITVCSSSKLAINTAFGCNLMIATRILFNAYFLANT